MNLWFPGINAFAESWFEALIRACWQGGLAIILVWAVCCALPKLPARVQCWLWRLAYLKLIIAFFWSGSIDLPLLPANVGDGRTYSARDAVSAGWLEGTEAVVSFPQQRALPSLESLMLVVWAFGAGWCALLVWKNWRKAHVLRAESTPLTETELNRWFLKLCQHLRLRRCPGLFVNRNTSGPLLAGVFRPMIILPSSVISSSSSEHLRMMLAHELAHHKRLDLWWAWLPTLGELLFFFHPLVRLAKREWRASQEMACDKLAVQATNSAVPDYAEMLLILAARYCRTSQEPKLSIVLNVIETKETLERRLKAMQFIKPNSSKRLAITTSLLLLMSAISILPWRVVAQNPQKAEVEIIPSSEKGELKIIKGERFLLQPVVGTQTNILSVIEPKSFTLTQARLTDNKGTNLLLLASQPPSQPTTEQPKLPAFQIFDGVSEGKRHLNVSAPRAGVIKKIHVKPGAKVKAGDRLIELDDREAKVKLEIAEARYQVAEAALKIQVAEADQTAAENVRKKKLSENKLISEDELKSNDISQARVEKARAELSLVRQQLKQAKLELETLIIRAPRDGTILGINVQEGEYTVASPKQPLVVVGDY